MRRTAGPMVMTVGVLILAMSASLSAEVLDHLDLGVAASERGHKVKSEGAEVPESRSFENEGAYVVAVSASAGTAPEGTLVQPGEWGVHRKGEWIEYELSRPTELDRVQVAWGRNQLFFFEIHVSVDGKSWEKVFEGRSWRRGSDEFETYSFEPVRSRYVRIVSGGRDTSTRRGRFFISQVRIGQLAHPEAYEPALAYRPGLGQPCRRLLPMGESWEGGWMSFVVRCSPQEQTYLTVKLWGSDGRQSLLYLRDEDGRWVVHAPGGRMRGGYNAAWTPLWEFAGDVAGGPFPGRFIYVTYPIPRSLTEGNSQVRLQIQAAGSRIGKPMQAPSQGIYDVPISLRTAELYIQHGRVFAERTPRINQIIPRVEAYRKVKELLPADHRLPMEPDHGDFAWADEDVAVFAVKHGDTLINGSFFLSRGGVVPLGRIHFSTPRIDRIATVKVNVAMMSSDQFHTIPEKLTGARKSVLGGKKYPIQPPPPGLNEGIDKAGNERWAEGDERANIADLYRIRFGDYLIAMNTTLKDTYRERTFSVETPAGIGKARELISGRMVDLSQPLKLGPRSTCILHLGSKERASRN